MKSMVDQAQLLEEDNSEAREAVYKQDREDTKMYDEITQELIKQMSILKEVDRLHEESGRSAEFQKIKFVEREEDPVLKATFEKDQ